MKYDPWIKTVLARAALQATTVNNDSFYVAIAGGTGTGKSTLSFHVIHEYHPNPSIEFVALDRQRFARAIHAAKDAPQPRWVNYDEADIIRREAMSQWNRDMLKLYAKIRGKNIFHIWCHPSVENLDKAQVEETLNVLLYIPRKTNPRAYWAFTKKAMIAILDDHNSLKHKVLLKHGRKYASHVGWFREYDGPLWKEYEELKETAQDEHIEEFYERWGKGECLSLKQAATRLGVGRTILTRVAKQALSDGRLDQSAYTPTGLWKLNPNHIEQLRDLLLERTTEGAS